MPYSLHRILGWLWHPPVGIYIGILAVVSVIMPLFRDFAKLSKKEKAFWTAVMFILVGLEFRSIYFDRSEHDQQEAADRTAQLEGFREIANSITKSIDASNTQFVATMRKTNQVLDNLTGGDSFAYVTPARNQGKDIPLLIHNHGNFPLAGISVAVRQLPEYDYRVYVLEKTLGPLGPRKSYLSGLVLTMTANVENDFIIEISAQNFSVTEYLNLRQAKVPAPNYWAYSYSVTQKDSIEGTGAAAKILIGKTKWTDEMKK